MTPAAVEAKAETEPLEAAAKHDLVSTAEEFPAVFTTTMEEQSEIIESRVTEADDKTSDIIIKPAEEAKVDGETAAVVITNELPTDQPSLEAVTTVDHSADIPPIEAVSTQVDATETVVASSEPTVEDVPLSTTVVPDVGSSLEANAETPLESENLAVERTPIEPEEIVDEQSEDRAEVEASPTTQAVPATVADVAPITTEAVTEEAETVGVLEQVI